MATNDPLSGIDEIDWKLYSHAYGSAEDVPPYLRKIQSEDEEERMLGYSGLYANIYHQGTRYDATPVAIPFLYKILDVSTTPQRDELLEYLVRLAIGGIDTGKPLGMSIGPWKDREELQHADLVPEQSQEEFLKMLDEAGDENAVFEESKVRRVQRRRVMGYQSYQAIRAGLSSIFACLENDSAVVRAYAVYALAWFPDEHEKTKQALFQLLNREQDFGVRATALFSLSILQTAMGDFSETQLVRYLRAVYSDTNSIEFLRWICSLCLVKLGFQTPEQLSSVVRKLTDEKYLEEYECSNLKDTAFPFVGHDIGGLGTLAAVELGSLRGSENPEVARLLMSLVTVVRVTTDCLALTRAALNVVFDGVEPNIEAGYNSFSPIQQELMESLAKANTNCHFANFYMLMVDWKLPRNEDEFQKFKETSADSIHQTGHIANVN